MRRIAVLAAVALTVASVVAIVAALAAGIVGGGSAQAAGEGQLLSAELVPDRGPAQEPTIAGIAPGGLPWVLEDGDVTLSKHGELRASVDGLLLGPGAPANLVGTTGPIKQVSASLVCANGPVVTTGPVPLSAKGDAHLHQRIALPGHCVGPVVLIRAFVAGNSGPWLAASGF